MKWFINDGFTYYREDQIKKYDVEAKTEYSELATTPSATIEKGEDLFIREDLVSSLKDAKLTEETPVVEEDTMPVEETPVVEEEDTTTKEK